jgi:hypothetical protein
MRTSCTATYTLTFPAVAPTANQVLTVSSISGGSVSLKWNSPDATGWSLTGNAGTSSSTFLGTLDAQPLVFRTDNNTRMTIGATGSINVNSLSGATGTASSTTNEGVIIADNNGLLSKASYSSLVAAGLLASTTGITVGGHLLAHRCIGIPKKSLPFEFCLSNHSLSHSSRFYRPINLR